MSLSAASVLRRYYAVSLVYALAGGFLAGVYPIFLRSRGLNQLEINSVLAVYFMVTFLTDVPTGAFADALGRRLSFVVGCALRCVAFALYFVSHTYVVFLVAETIDAVGTTFCNGAVDAWGVDALDGQAEPSPRGAPLYDEPLAARVIAFQRAQKLAADGIVGAETMAKLSAVIDPAAPSLARARSGS